MSATRVLQFDINHSCDVKLEVKRVISKHHDTRFEIHCSAKNITQYNIPINTLDLCIENEFSESIYKTGIFKVPTYKLQSGESVDYVIKLPLEYNNSGLRYVNAFIIITTHTPIQYKVHKKTAVFDANILIDDNALSKQ